MNQDQINGNDANLNVENADEFQIRVDFPNAPPSAASGEIDAADVDFGLMDTLTGGASVAERMEERSKSAILAAMTTIQEMALQTDLMRKGIPGGSQPRMIKIKFGVNLDFEAGRCWLAPAWAPPWRSSWSGRGARTMCCACCGRRQMWKARSLLHQMNRSS
ncbi:MAG: hypothetical protein R3A44_15260 [Caldilineaceae bacterium]